MTLGRIYYHDPDLENIPTKEIKYFVNDTYRWLENYSNNRTLISESFMKHLDDLARFNV